MKDDANGGKKILLPKSKSLSK